MIVVPLLVVVRPDDDRAVGRHRDAGAPDRFVVPHARVREAAELAGPRRRRADLDLIDERFGDRTATERRRIGELLQRAVGIVRGEEALPFSDRLRPLRLFGRRRRRRIDRRDRGDGRWIRRGARRTGRLLRRVHDARPPEVADDRRGRDEHDRGDVAHHPRLRRTCRDRFGRCRRREIARAQPRRADERHRHGLVVALRDVRIVAGDHRRRRLLRLHQPHAVARELFGFGRDPLEIRHARDVDEGDLPGVERPREGVAQLFRRLEAPVRISLERLFEPLVERRRKIRPHLRRDRGRCRGDRRERHRDPLIGVPDRAAREALVRHTPERPKIGAVVDRPLPLHLLGRHVRGRSEDRPFAGEARRLFVGANRRVELGETKIQDLRDLVPLFTLREVDVFGLKIAVDDAGGVRLGEAARDLRDDPHRRRRIDEADARHTIVERLTVEVLHRDERATVFEAPRVVHLDDVRALNAGGGARLAEEALDDDRRVRQLGREHLDRHRLTDADVLGLVDDRHPAAPDFARDAVLADEQGSRGDLRFGLDDGHRVGVRT